MFFFFFFNDNKADELRKLSKVERSDNGLCVEQGLYAGRLSRLADSFTSVPTEYESAKSLLAEEVMYQALALRMHAIGYEAMTSDDAAKDDIEKPYEISDKCAKLVETLLPNATADVKAEVTEDIMRRICFVLYGCCGTTYLQDTSENGDAEPEDCKRIIYLIGEYDDEGGLVSSVYDIDNFTDVLNMEKEDFIPEFNAFVNKYCIDKDEDDVNFDLWPLNAQKATVVDWNHLMDGNKEYAVNFIATMSGREDKNLLRKIRRQFSQRNNTPCPVDVEKLKTDAEKADESLHNRMDMLAAWLRSQQSLTEEYQALREERDLFKKQLNIFQAQRAVDGQERDKQAEEDKKNIELLSKCQQEYDNAIQNLSIKAQENNSLQERVKQLESELKEARGIIEDKDKQLAARKASDKVKVLQEQLDTANNNYKQLQDSVQQGIDTAVISARAANIKSFLDGLRQRCKNKSPEKIGFLFDDLKDSSWGFPELQKAIRELHTDLTSEPTQEERRTRAMERQADKPSGPIHMDVKSGGIGIGSIDEINTLPKSDKPKEIVE